MPIADVAILGSGPAAWAAASACCQEGLSVTLIAPNPHANWSQTYGVWVDQFDAPVRKLFGLTDGDPLPLSHQWPAIAAVTDSRRDLKRAYGLLDNAVVRATLEAQAHATGLLTVRTATAQEVTHNQWSSVALSKGRAVSARLVIDATGSQSAFVQRQTASGQQPGRTGNVHASATVNAPGNATGYAMQAAYGVVAEVDRAPYASSVLMDWTGPNRRDASFLYALDLGGRWLLEETSLARNPPLSPAELKARLEVRLAGMNVNITKVHAEEHVLFPMDLALPVVGQRTLAIGAAGAIVHPATGYSVAASLRLAPRLAESLREAFENPSANAQDIVDAGWRAVWPLDRRRARNLESYGLERLLTMSQSEIRAFFQTFFALGPEVMSTYLGGDASSSELAAVMWKVFQKAPMRLRSRLASGNPLTLARTLLS
jgi:flavin-dependent dehydrogenase